MQPSFKNKSTHAKRQASNTPIDGYHPDQRVSDRTLDAPIAKETEANMITTTSSLANSSSEENNKESKLSPID